MCLFLLGLLTGFVESRFANVRMGLAAHLKGVMNGILLLALFVTALAAVFGTAALSPITAAGHTGRIWQESLVTIGFLTVGVATVVLSVLMLWGLRANR